MNNTPFVVYSCIKQLTLGTWSMSGQLASLLAQFALLGNYSISVLLFVMF